MGINGTNIGASSYVSAITSNTVLVSSVITTGAPSGVTFTGDVFKIALLVASPTGGVYSSPLTQLNYGTGAGTPGAVNLGTDELANGLGYTTGGIALTNVSAVLSGSVGVATFSVAPSWGASATFITSGALIYNTSQRQGWTGAVSTSNPGGAGHTVSYHDFGGTQQVTSGTFTLNLPTANSTTGLLRIS